MAIDVQTNPVQGNDISFLEDLPDADLESIWEAVKDGVDCYGTAMGFDEPVLNSVEDIALSYYRSCRYQEAAVIYGFRF